MYNNNNKYIFRYKYIYRLLILLDIFAVSSVTRPSVMSVIYDAISIFRKYLTHLNPMYDFVSRCLKIARVIKKYDLPY